MEEDKEKNLQEKKMFTIKECDDYEIAKTLIREYSQIQGAEECFVSLENELSDLESYYKGGAFFIGFEDDIPSATFAIKKIDEVTCEAKRIYIKPESRGKGYARMLVNKMLERSRELGFKEITLTTKPEIMNVAYNLYKKIGFEEVGKVNGTVTMSLRF